jgi:redox-sensitive bicupin YhaK (pirin superfamily)
MKKNIIVHKAESRGKADHGWLKSRHTFSFAGYYNPERVNFGALRVLNDDIVKGGMGFSKHPHDNMEIISIPLLGDLEHKDSMGNTTVISQNDVQIMSAGTGVVHSEYNKNKNSEVHFLQIWVFPKERNITARYDQKTFLKADRINKLQTIVSPDGEDAIKINQDAWFMLGSFEDGNTISYNFRSKNSGLYAFVLEGKFKIAGQSLEKRDGLGITEVNSIEIEAISNDAEILLMELPLTGF